MRAIIRPSSPKEVNLRKARLSPLLLSAVLVCVLRVSPAPAQPVGPEFRVNTYTTDKQQHPRIATDSGGTFIVVWGSVTQDGSLFGVFGQRYGSTGAPLGAEFRVNTFTTNQQSLPCVVSDSGGNFVVVWQGYTQDGSLSGVFGQRYGSAGAPLGTEFRVNTYTTSDQRYPSVANGSGGSFIVVWGSVTQDGSSLGVFGQRYGSAGAPLGVEFRANTYTTGTQSFPSVASDSGGSFVVVWHSFAQDGSGYGVFGQRYGSAGAPLGTEFRVNTYTTGYQRFSSVAGDSGGNFVVVWESNRQDGQSLSVFGQRYGSAGAPLGAEFLVNSFTTDTQFFPSVTSDPSGNFVVVWGGNIQDGSLSGVFLQRYGSDGAPLGTEFRVNTYTTNDQFSPSVASDSGGSFVVVWESDTQDGSSRGVFGQRFGCPPLSSVTISVIGTTIVCTTSTGGTATVTDVGGGTRSHLWGYRTTTGGPTFPIAGQTGTTYQINGADFPAPALSFLVCQTTPGCGPLTFSNEISVIVTTDISAPMVTPPSALTTTQTLCM